MSVGKWSCSMDQYGSLQQFYFSIMILTPLEENAISLYENL